MKPILIDALYINSGGALTVLNRLIEGLAGSKVAFVLIKDIRCKPLQFEQNAQKVITMKPSIGSRFLYYLHNKEKFHSVLCMGNVPPPIKLACHVSTYFHNISLLEPASTYSKRRRILFYLKKKFISYLSANTNDWIVQTWNTENILKRHLKDKEKRMLIFPIYSIPDDFARLATITDRHDYLFIGDYTFSKGHDVLIEAWEKLYDMGLSVNLHLTVNRRPATENFYKKMEEKIKKGVPIINHGFVPFSEVSDLYGNAKAIVYPSLTESLGLGVVEGITAGCDVIVSDLDYAHSICLPSEVFDPNSAESIKQAIIRYEEGLSLQSKLTIKDCCEELINHISK